jgi:hypothetical protein
VTEELAVLADAVGRLEQIGVPYMLTGSFALGYYAQPRMTRAVDLVVALASTDADRLVEAFGADYYVAAEAVHEAIGRRGMFNAIHLASMWKVDFVVRKDEPYRLVEFERRREVVLAGLSLWIVSREDLVISKLEWARTSRSEAVW